MDTSQANYIVHAIDRVTSTISGAGLTLSENLAQVNGATVNVGTGVAGTGTQRVSVSSDSTIITKGDVADNAALVNLNPNYVGGKAAAGDGSYSPAYTANDAAALAIDTVNGGLLCHINDLSAASDSVATFEKPDATSTYAPSSDVSAALEASSVSKASAGVFYGMAGYNSLGSAQWILVYNSATVPANGAVTPIAVIRAAASSPFSFDTGKFGIYCSAGISWSNSIDATIFNKTLGAADCFANLLYK